MNYEMNPGVMAAVQQLKREGMSDAVRIYCGAPLAYTAIMQPNPDWSYFKTQLYCALDAGRRRGYNADTIFATFCELCLIDQKLVLTMIT